MGILITGASAGLGAALARECAAPGVTLHLSARDVTRLAATTTACAAKGATVHPVGLDVRDAAGMRAWIAGAGRLDLVIANAGISAGTGTGMEAPEVVRDIFDTNVTGVLNTCLPAIEAMVEQPPGADGLRGRVAVIASIAAFVAGPTAPAYCASKSAVQRWAEARDATERQRGIRLHAICPGFIRTAITDRNAFPMPGLMEPEEAAQRTLAGIRAGRLRVVYPWGLYAMSRVTGALPPTWRNALLMRFEPKAA
ncbi:SDR family NAD(P)-dependent oxidoreductase [Roseococcus sp. SDR]|uniref:SDR family NAD(P)-dependent oxidoreductase n=1 Tax=Roseococcus sp. SDR TaxID=2835532 RepID=UPI001BCD9A99|nr:SDR family NAD(P)-dependent oxidoreductase [Roseococcus sp. SDR]MBS7790860.1 SDR family NAD(P)-dependent oxidoreductase [Roseococcus sp. SDR]MBV1846174.1 SDR family NAD(P)-dependent oxidoreductase [Roseococcus sp. SDR]